MSGPLQKIGEPRGYVISESLAAIDRRVLETAGRVPGELGNVTCVKVSDEEYAALSKHPAYDYQPDGDRADREAHSLPPHLRGRLERRGQNILLISKSLAAVHDRRLAEVRAQTLKLLEARTALAGQDQGTAVQSPPGEPLIATQQSNGADGEHGILTARKPASGWARFIFSGLPVPKADATLALELILGELGISVDEQALSFQSDPVSQGTFVSTLERLTGSDLGWRTLVQIYEREEQRADH